MAIQRGYHPGKVACGCVLVLLLASPGRAGQKTVPIGVTVGIDAGIRQFWTLEQQSQVRTGALKEFKAAAEKRLLHWDLVDPCNTPVNAVLTLSLAKRGDHQLIAGIILAFEKDISSTPAVLVEDCCWDAADFAIWGSPDADKATSKLSAFLKRVFPSASGGTDDLRWDDRQVRGKVPIATSPKPFDPNQRTYVLPLPKERYSYLCWSKFRLHASGPPETSELDVTGRGEWKPYDLTLPDSLLVAAAATPPDNYNPSLVYLQEYIPADNGVAWENP